MEEQRRKREKRTRVKREERIIKGGRKGEPENRGREERDIV